MSAYILTNLRQVYGGRTVLAIDRLEIATGRIHALLGPNGAGKTTLLDILAFLSVPTSGTIHFQGKPVSFANRELEKCRRQVVLVDQHPIMFSTSVAANIEFGLKIRNTGKQDRQRIVDRVLDIVGLTHYRQTPAHKLSGGETQRLALARALALEPAVLLCDEPTASVDVRHQNIIWELLQRINAELGTTIVFTTHDRVQAASVAQQSLVLDRGRLSDTTHENCFAAALTKTRDGLLQCTMQNTVQFVLPLRPPLPDLEGSVELRIEPSKIVFRKSDAIPHSRHEVHGKVLLIMAENEHVRMLVNCGIVITLILQRDHYLSERPLVGDDVALTIPQNAITVRTTHDDIQTADKLTELFDDPTRSLDITPIYISH